MARMDWVRAFNRSVEEEGTNSMMVKRLKQAWKRDRLGVLGVGSAVVAFVLWAWRVPVNEARYKDYWIWFSGDRLPAVGAFLALAVILLLLRRR